MENRKIHLAIFASGNGSNAENIIRFAQENHQSLVVECIITDNHKAKVIERANKHSIPIKIIHCKKSSISNKKEHENKILQALQEYKIDWILLAGYMRILSSNFLDNFYHQQLGVYRVINIHPALLPSFPGKDSYQQAFYAGVKVVGITVHFVDSGIDTGLAIVQEPFERNPLDTLEDFIERGLKVEYRLYRQALKYIMEDRISIIPIANSNQRIVYIKKET